MQNNENMFIFKKYNYKLLENSFLKQDIVIDNKVLYSLRTTILSYIRNLKISFSKKIDVKYVIMVNSDLSVNSLATFCGRKFLEKKCFKRCDEILVSVLCWLTSTYP